MMTSRKMAQGVPNCAHGITVSEGMEDGKPGIWVRHGKDAPPGRFFAQADDLSAVIAWLEGQHVELANA